MIDGMWFDCLMEPKAFNRSGSQAHLPAISRLGLPGAFCAAARRRRKSDNDNGVVLAIDQEVQGRNAHRARLAAALRKRMEPVGPLRREILAAAAGISVKILESWLDGRAEPTSWQIGRLIVATDAQLWMEVYGPIHDEAQRLFEARLANAQEQASARTRGAGDAGGKERMRGILRHVMIGTVKDRSDASLDWTRRKQVVNSPPPNRWRGARGRLVAHKLDRLLQPRSVALVGASPKAGTVGRGMITSTGMVGTPSKIYFVNPGYDEIDGQKCYKSLSDLPEVVDMAVLGIANARLEAALDEIIACGIGAATIFASGYLENDTEPKLTERISQKAQGRRHCHLRRQRHGLLSPGLRPARLRVSAAGLVAQGNRWPSSRIQARLFGAVPQRQAIGLQPCRFGGAGIGDRGRRLYGFRPRYPGHQGRGPVPGDRARSRRFQGGTRQGAGEEHARGGAESRTHGGECGTRCLAFRRHRRQSCGLSGAVRSLRRH